MALNLGKLMKRGAAPPAMDALMAAGGAPAPGAMVPPEDMSQLMKGAVKPAPAKRKAKPKRRGKRY